MRIYLATSWKNPRYEIVRETLRVQGHEVYDFKAANASFNWSQIDPSWDPGNPVLRPADLQRALVSEPAAKAFAHDKDALDWCDVGVLLMPCGASAHIEVGYLVGCGKPVHVLYTEEARPELMHLLAGRGHFHSHIDTLIEALRPPSEQEIRAAIERAIERF